MFAFCQKKNTVPVLICYEAVVHDLPITLSPSVEYAITVERGHLNSSEADSVVTLILLVL
jgi:hypothetical protein